MKCQLCGKAATFHITELTGVIPQEHHLCERHARDYLSETSESGPNSMSVATTLNQEQSFKPISLSQVADGLKDIDKKTCDICGMSFHDFRSRGRLGCPNDYDCFGKQLELLILNIHGEQEHVGKTIKTHAGKTSDRTPLIQLRRELNEAVKVENYAQASILRDKIKEVEAG
ncbi:MAG: UvrB/UvrC motif-containing protein [Thermoguttaceae bacterium]